LAVTGVGDGARGYLKVVRVAVDMMSACFLFDLYQLHALRRVEAL